MSKLNNERISLMVTGFWGRKIGMTQIFADNKAIPVTAIRTGNWLVTAFKTKERDGYDAVQIACLKDKYSNQAFSANWLKKLSTYFSLVREVHLSEPVAGLTVGKPLEAAMVVSEGDMVDVVGISKGLGFQGVVKRHGFGGPPGSHGSDMGKRPGSIGFMRECGRVIKGKKMPGHTGNARRTVKGLQIAKIGLEMGAIVLVKGSIPGKAGSAVFVRKCNDRL